MDLIQPRMAFQDICCEYMKLSEYVIPPIITSTSQRLYKDDFKTSVTSFPKIDVKYLEKTPSIVGNGNNQNKTFENQNNINTTEDNDDDDEDEEESSKHSQLFIHDRANNDYYLLEFKAINVLVVPVYLKYRTYEENKNEKCIQPRSNTVYETIYNNKAKRFNQLLKSFQLDKSKNSDRISVMSNKKPILKKRPACPLDPKPKPSISAPVSNIRESIVYITYKDVDYQIKPGVMILKSSKPIDYEAEEKRKKLMKDLHMELPLNFKNKAQLIVNYKGDILKFAFTISEVNCNKLKVTTSVGIMVEDENCYIREFSTISNKVIFIPLPKSTYDYTDGMNKEREKNMAMKLQKIDPRWLVEQRKKRLKEYYQCRQKNPYDDILELKIGSSIYYDSFNCSNRVKGGTLHCTLSEKQYEDWLKGLQKVDSPQTEERTGENFESNFAETIPDWDLVMNFK